MLGELARSKLQALGRILNQRTDSLEIIPGVALGGAGILADISPECKHQVDDDGGAHGEQRGVNKILANPGSSDPHTVANGRTNAKGIPFYKFFEPAHAANLNKMPEKAYPLRVCTRYKFMSGRHWFSLH